MEEKAPHDPGGFQQTALQRSSNRSADSQHGGNDLRHMIDSRFLPGMRVEWKKCALVPQYDHVSQFTVHFIAWRYLYSER
jgi:hypothetical protein